MTRAMDPAPISASSIAEPPVSPIGALAEALLRGYTRIAPTERGGYRLVRLVRRFRSPNARRGIFKTPDGLRLELDLDVYPDCSMAYGLYELDTARTLRQILRPGDHVVDGGANIGYFSLLAARCVGPSGRVDAFEPQPETRQRLSENLQRNNLADIVRIHPHALSDHAGTATIHRFGQDAGNHGTASLFAPAGADTTDTEIETVRMDKALAGSTPRLIKLDLEGAEAQAIDGMTALLQGDRPPDLIIEHNPAKAREMNLPATHLVDRVLAARPDYRIDVIDWRLRPIVRDPALLESLRQVNLLFRARPGGPA